MRKILVLPGIYFIFTTLRTLLVQIVLRIEYIIIRVSMSVFVVPVLRYLYNNRIIMSEVCVI